MYSSGIVQIKSASVRKEWELEYVVVKADKYSEYNAVESECKQNCFHNHNFILVLYNYNGRQKSYIRVASGNLPFSRP